MSVQDEINRINQNITNTYTVLNAKGATMPDSQNSDNLASTVLTVPQEGGVSVQADYNQNDAAQPDYIKNRPFYDDRIFSHFSQSETPASIRFDIPALNFTLWKISDLVPTREELFSNTKFTYGEHGTECPNEANITIETNDFITFNLYFSNNEYGFAVMYTAGSVIVNYMGYSIPIEVPETGIYFIVDLGATIYPTTTFDIQIGELKKLDEKFMPEKSLNFEQPDYNENNPDSPAYIRNRPFYEGRMTSHFNSDETPEPPSFTDTLFNHTWFKASDLMPKGDELFGATFTVSLSGAGSISWTPTQGDVAVQNNDLVVLMLNAGGVQLAFAVAYNTGELKFGYMGAQGTIVVDEEGVYFASAFSNLPSGVTVDIEYEGAKRIDPKFLPSSIGGGVRVVEVVYDDTDNDNLGFIQLDDTTANEIDKMIGSGEAFVLKLVAPMGALDTMSVMFLQHSGSGIFYLFVTGVLMQLEYNRFDKTLNMSLHSLSGTATYSLRNSTQMTFSEFIEMITESARQRGLIK